jgi:deoxyadenosine kinase
MTLDATKAICVSHDPQDPENERQKLVLTLLAEESIEMLTNRNSVFTPPQESLERYAKLIGCIISLNGNIAASKTTTGRCLESEIRAIAEKLPRTGDLPSLRPHFMKEETPLLSLFAEDPKQYAFMFQMDQLRLTQIKYLNASHMREKGFTVLIDRDLWGNRIFCIANYLLGNISKEQLEIYLREVKRVENMYVNYEVLQWASPEECHRRSVVRMIEQGRKEESGLKIDYFDLIDRLHLIFALAEIKKGTNRIVLVNCDKFVPPAVVLGAVMNHLALPAYQIEGDPRDLYYTSVEQRRKIVEDLIHTRTCVIPHAQRAVSPRGSAAARSKEHHVLAGFCGSDLGRHDVSLSVVPFGMLDDSGRAVLRSKPKKCLHISFCGLIGAGKTTLTSLLAELLHLPTYFENVIDNALLSDFYSSMSEHSFKLEMHLLNERVEQQRQITKASEGGVQDRTIYEDAVFADTLRHQGLLSARDHEIYVRSARLMRDGLEEPDVVVFLDAEPALCLERIKTRSLKFEQKISLEYLEQLQKGYQALLTNFESMSVKVIRHKVDAQATPASIAQELASKIVGSR